MLRRGKGGSKESHEATVVITEKKKKRRCGSSEKIQKLSSHTISELNPGLPHLKSVPLFRMCLVEHRCNSISWGMCVSFFLGIRVCILKYRIKGLAFVLIDF